MIKMPTIDVVLFMIDAHAGQTRMGGEPYFTHPLAVVGILRNQLKVKFDLTDQAALIHDCEEDCADRGFDQKYLEEKFGEPAELAHWLCKPERPIGVDKPEWNKMCYMKIGKHAPPDAQQIKIADRLHNLSDPGRWNQRFRVNYIADTKNLIEAMKHVKNIELVSRRLDDICNGSL